MIDAVLEVPASSLRQPVIDDMNMRGITRETQRKNGCPQGCG